MRKIIFWLMLVPAVLGADSFEVAVSGHGDQHMILIPGLACSGKVWQETAAHFGDRYRVHTLTLAGFAGREPIHGPLLVQVRDELIAYIGQNRLVRPVIMGHSLGGFMAFYLASAEPDLVGPVIAVDGVPFIGALFQEDATEENMRPRAEMMRNMMAGLDAVNYAGQTRMAMRSMITDDTQFETVLAQSIQSHPPTVGLAVYEMMTTDLRDDVAAIKSAVLLLAAGADMTEQESAATKTTYLAQIKAIGNARLVVAEKARHFIMLDDPGFFQRTVSSFLTEVTPAGGAL